MNFDQGSEGVHSDGGISVDLGRGWGWGVFRKQKRQEKETDEQRHDNRKVHKMF